MNTPTVAALSSAMTTTTPSTTTASIIMAASSNRGSNNNNNNNTSNRISKIDDDVLISRASIKEARNHPGNVFLKQLVLDKLEEYDRADQKADYTDPTKRSRDVINHEIAHAVHERGGRFLYQVKRGAPWQLATKQQVMNKVCRVRSECHAAATASTKKSNQREKLPGAQATRKKSNVRPSEGSVVQPINGEAGDAVVMQNQNKRPRPSMDYVKAASSSTLTHPTPPPTPATTIRPGAFRSTLNNTNSSHRQVSSQRDNTIATVAQLLSPEARSDSMDSNATAAASGSQYGMVIKTTTALSSHSIDVESTTDNGTSIQNLANSDVQSDHPTSSGAAAAVAKASNSLSSPVMTPVTSTDDVASIATVATFHNSTAKGAPWNTESSVMDRSDLLTVDSGRTVMSNSNMMLDGYFSTSNNNASNANTATSFMLYQDDDDQEDASSIKTRAPDTPPRTQPQFATASFTRPSYRDVAAGEAVAAGAMLDLMSLDGTRSHSTTDTVSMLQATLGTFSIAAQSVKSGTTNNSKQQQQPQQHLHSHSQASRGLPRLPEELQIVEETEKSATIDSIMQQLAVGLDNAIVVRSCLQDLLQNFGLWAEKQRKDDGGGQQVAQQSGASSPPAAHLPSTKGQQQQNAVVSESIVAHRFLVLMKALRRHESDVAVQESGCTLLGKLAWDYQTAIAKAGGIDCVLQAMKKFPTNKNIQTNACHAIASLASNHATNQAKIASEGGLDCIVHAMRQLPNSFLVQRKACEAIARLTKFNAANQTEFGNEETNGGIACVVEATRQFPRHTGVLENAFWAVARLVEHHSTNQTTFVTQAHSLDYIIRAMQQYPHHEEVQWNACWALGRLAENHERNQTRIAQDGGMACVVQTIVRFSQRDVIRQTACEAIGNLVANHGSNQIAVGKTEAIACIVEYLRQRVSEGWAFWEPCWALEAFAAGCEANQSQIVELKGDAVLLEMEKALDEEDRDELKKRCATLNTHCFLNWTGFSLMIDGYQNDNRLWRSHRQLS